jgi:replicative DNA helicase Mcm
MEKPNINLEEIEKNAGDNPYTAKFLSFFEMVYKKQIQRLVEQYPEERSLEVDYRDLEKFDFALADDLIDKPMPLLKAAEQAIEMIEVPALEIDEFKPHIRFFNLPKDVDLMIKSISSRHLGKMISVEGVVRQITDVLPKMNVGFFECRKCGTTYRIEQDESRLKQPVSCESCRAREFALVNESSEFIDYQKIQIQEPLEKLKGNEQASYLDVHVTDDIVNKITVGNKTRFTGILILEPNKDKKVVYNRFLEVVHLEETQQEFDLIEVSSEEEAEIEELAKDPNVYDNLINSIAPAIYGHDIIKEAIVLQLFSGMRKVLPNNPRIRGNIHILLVGDPSTGKSQLLQATHNIAPKSIYFSGKTTTGVGLTATAVKDDFGEGGWTLKAGALVLASGGTCMADELDKLDNDERSALHEAMEQGTISVAKAGIVTRFQSDTSILAAANPKFSRFDPYSTSFIDQINLPVTLISRFDLFFMVRDILDKTKDQDLAQHILKTHQSGEILLQSAKKGHALTQEIKEEIKGLTNPKIEGEMMRKYISFARQNRFPVLSQDAIKEISDFYVGLRELGKKEDSYAATHRQLEGLVRLSEASARVRLSDVVEKVDAERAVRLLKTSLEDLVTDPETGKIDYDIIATGRTHTQVTNIRKVLNIIKSKAQEMDMVPMQDVVEEAQQEGITPEKTRETIEELIKKGEVYSPRHRFVKPMQRQ